MAYRYPVFFGIGVGALAIFLIIFGCVRLLCCRCRRKKGIKYSDKPLNLAPYKGYNPTANPPAYEPPESAHLNANRNPRTKNDALPPTPTQGVENQNQVPNEPHGDVELGRLEPVHAPKSSTLVHPTPSSTVGLNLSKPLPESQNPFNEPPRPSNPFDVKPQPLIPLDTPPHTRNPSESGLIENQERKPPSPPSPKRSYSPYPPSINTRYTPSPFTELSDSRQPSPFSPSTHARTFSYVPSQPSYAGYSPAASTLHDRSPKELKSPYRAYSPALSVRTPLDHSSIQESQNPFRTHTPSVSISHESASINHEPIELSTPYTTRPQSLVMDEDLHRQEILPPHPKISELQESARNSIASPQSPNISQMPGAWHEPLKGRQNRPSAHTSQ